MAVQEARTVRCNELEESEATYSKAILENVAMKSLHCSATLQGTHKAYAAVGRADLGGRKQKPPRLSPHTSSYPVQCTTVSQRGSTFLLLHLIGAIILLTSIHSVCQGTQDREPTICTHFSQVRTQMGPMAKKAESLARSTGRHIHR